MGRIYLGLPEKSAVAEQRFEMEHNTYFSNTSILDKAPRYMGSLKKEAVEIRLHSRSFNGDGGLNLSWSWYPVTNTIKQHGDKPI
jgi:hypothetical protein